MSHETGVPVNFEAQTACTESLFPIGLDEIMPARDRLLKLQTDDLRSFVAVRREGAPQDPVTVLYHAGFAQWHQERGDFASEQAVNMYRAGKLYGATLALDRYRAKTGKELVADDADAYAAAKSVVLHSYDEPGLEEAGRRADRTRGAYIGSVNAGRFYMISPLRPDTADASGASDAPRPANWLWRADCQREQRYLHGKMLALLNAGLHDHTLEQYNEVYSGTIPKDEALESFYTGLVDAAIFITTYASYRDDNRLPEKAGITDLERYLGRPDLYYDVRDALTVEAAYGMTLELEAGDIEFYELLDRMDVERTPTHRQVVSVDGQQYALAYLPTIEQVGPNSFRLVYDIQGIYEVLPPSLAQRAKYAGVVALVGAAAANANDAWLPNSPAAIGLATLLGALVGGATGLAAHPDFKNRDASLVWNAPEFDAAEKNLAITLQKK